MEATHLIILLHPVSQVTDQAAELEWACSYKGCAADPACGQDALHRDCIFQQTQGGL
jgi:hypothetical protein